MSKRFGRNQKRKLQQKVGVLEEALEMQKGLGSYLASEHNKDVSTLKEVRRILGAYTAILEPQISRGNKPESDRVNISKFEMPSYISQPDEEISDLALHNQVSYLLDFVEKKNPIEDAVHLEFHWKDKTVGYAISEEAMHILPTEFLIKDIANEMARIMVTNIKSKRK